MEREREKHGYSVKKMIAMQACEEYASYYQKHFLYDQTAKNRAEMMEQLYELHGNTIGSETGPGEVEAFLRENVKEEWYLSEMQYQVILEEEIFFHKRMSSFFVGQNKISGKQRYEVQLTKEIPNTYSSTVYGHAHAVIDAGGVPMALLIMDGISHYSKRARIIENKAAYSPQLLSLYLGLKDRYEGNLLVSLVFLKQDKDNKEKPFNPDKQVVTADFREEDETELRERLFDALTRNKSANCETCSYATLCGQNRLLEEENESTPLPKRADPKFTAAQRQVVEFGKGACAVHAVPGAGKTTVLVYRLCRLLQSGVDPKSILFVTFTNKAANEIRDRVKAILATEHEAELPDIYTYNGLGWQIIRDHPEVVGEKKLLSPLDEKLLILEILNESQQLVGYSYKYMQGKFGILNLLKSSFAGLEKNEELEMEALARKGCDSEQVKDFYRLWLSRREENHFINYDEQITLALEILKQRPEILKGYAAKWEYIMADEFQDSSQENVDLLYLIARAGEENIVVVGDADQSIFEWRNGSPKHLLSFDREFSAKKIVMRDNFRSTDKILQASNELIARNENRLNIFMQAHKEGQAFPYRVTGATVETVPFILSMLQKKRFLYGDVAVLARKNITLQKLKEVLDREGIGSRSPSDYLIHDAFFQAVKDVITLYVDGLDDDFALYRTFKVLGIQMQEKEFPEESFYRNILKTGVIPLDIHDMDSNMEYAVKDEEREGDRLYNGLCRVFRLFLSIEGGKVKDIPNIVGQELGIKENDPALLALCAVIDQHSPMENVSDLKQYMENMVIFSDETMVEYDIDPKKVNLMTAHGAKGKEFPAVIVVNCEDFHDNEEERRLMYVAMTRAKKVLFLFESPYLKCELLDELDSLQPMTL